MTRIVALTEAGKTLAARVASGIDDAEIWYRPEPFADRVQQAFREGHTLILICATGIAVRTLAPVLVSKHDDPPVLVLDQDGRFVIPLLSGHEGGANELAREVAAHLGATAIQTTARPYTEPVYVLGLGCERGTSCDEMAQLVEHVLAQSGVELARVAAIASIELKADEAGLIELGARLGKPFRVYSAEALARMESLLANRSDYVHAVTGVYGVAESAALLAAEEAASATPELLVTKHKSTRATCALARAYPEPQPSTERQ